MTCRKCGSGLHIGARFCEVCGSSSRRQTQTREYGYSDRGNEPPWILSAPEKPWVETDILSWDYVDNAEGYVVVINGRALRNVFYEPGLDLRRLQLENGKYVIRIMAIGDGGAFFDSPLSVPVTYIKDRRQHMGFVLGLAVVLLFVFAHLSGLTSRLSSPAVLQSLVTSAEALVLEVRVFELTNAEREYLGLPPLIWCDLLADAARAHNLDMIRNSFFAHEGSDGSSPGIRIEREGFMWSIAAENIAAGQPTPEEVVQAWKDSPGHWVNMISPDLTHLGVGFNVSPQSRHRYYWGQKFATQRYAEGQLEGY